MSMQFPGRAVRRRFAALTLVAATAVALTACSTAAPTPTATSASSINVAFIGTNTVTYQTAIYDGLKSVKGIHTTFIEVGEDEVKQAQAIDDAVASGKYQGIVALPASPTALIASVKKAIAAHVQFINTEAEFGPNPLDGNVQIKGQAASIVDDWSNVAKLEWKAALDYCKSKDIKVCHVARIDGLPQFASSTLFKTADKDSAEAAGSSAVMIPTLFSGGFDGPTGLAAAQDLLAAHPDVNVIIAYDPQLIGIQQAVEASGLKIGLVGQAGTNEGLAHVRDGQWYADIASFPYTAGVLAGQAMLKHVADPKLAGQNIAPVLKGVGPLFTKKNISTYKGQYN